MGITDPTEEYFKDGGWHWNGTKWIKGGLAFEYKEAILGRAYDTTAAAGNNTLFSGAVPAGEIWVITSLAAHDETTGVTKISMGVQRAGTNYYCASTAPVAAGVILPWAGTLCLVEADKLLCVLVGCTLNDRLFFWYFGYKMRVS